MQIAPGVRPLAAPPRFHPRGTGTRRSWTRVDEAGDQRRPLSATSAGRGCRVSVSATMQNRHNRHLALWQLGWLCCGVKIGQHNDGHAYAGAASHSIGPQSNLQRQARAGTDNPGHRLYKKAKRAFHDETRSRWRHRTSKPSEPDRTKYESRSICDVMPLPDRKSGIGAATTSEP